METKVCKICGEEKTLSDFYIKKVKDGIPTHRAECKICTQKYQQEYRTKNKGKKNKYDKKYYVDNKDETLKYQKEYRTQNLEEVKKYQKEYSNINKEEIKEYKKQYKKNRIKSDINFHLKSNISTNISNILKSRGFSKNGKPTLKYLPYTTNELKKHLESLFEPWMTWNNYGKYNAKIWDDNNQVTWTWQLDHIVPHSTFNYTSMEDQTFKDCWALSNLRPLSAKQNWLDGISRVRHGGNNGTM